MMQSEKFDRLDTDAVRLLFVWLCLLFLKTHLKDKLGTRVLGSAR